MFMGARFWECNIAMHCMAFIMGLHCHREGKGLVHTFPDISGGNGNLLSSQVGNEGRHLTGQGLGDAGMGEVPAV